MSNEVNILNVKTVQKSPIQTQVKSAKHTGDNILSFLNLLQNSANSGRIENSDKLNSFQNNNLNKTANLENKGKNNILNNGAKISDINNAKISLENSADKNGGLAAALTKVLSGETAGISGLSELSEFDEVSLAEAIKEIIAGLIVKDDDGEKIDIGKMLEILGMPAEIIPEMIASVIAPKMTADKVETIENAGNRQLFEVTGITAFRESPEITSETESAPLLISVNEAEDFITETAEYIYSERMAEMIDSAEAVPEQVRENIVDFADIIEENVDFKSAIADYAAEKIGKIEQTEINNPAAVKINAENLKEIIRQVLNEEPTELEVLSAVKLSEASTEKSAPTMFDILNSMRKTVNITQVQAAAAENNNAEIVEPIEIAVNVSVPEISADEIMPVAETEAETNANVSVSVNDVNGAEVAATNNLTGIINAGAGTQSLESEVNIKEFAANVSRVINEKTQGILNRKGQGADETFELRLRLKPAELGEIFMKISYKNGNVGVNIIAANAAAERAILSQMGDLRTNLEAREINLAEFDVSQFNNYNQNTQNQNSQQSNESNDKKNNGSVSGRTGLNNNINNTNEVQNKQEAERREAVANYIKSRRIFYKTI